MHSLSELVSIIETKADIFLDVKENEVTKQDLLAVFQGKHYRTIYVARNSLEYLENLGELPRGWKKVQNASFAFTPNIKRLKEADVSVFEGFFWSATRQNIDLLKQNDMNYALATWFLSKRTYCALSEKYEMEWVHAEKLL